MITTEQIRHIHTILPAQIKGDPEAKADLISQFTGQADKTSTRDLSATQAEELIYFLKTGKRPSRAHYAAFDASNKQHMYILSICHQLGWVSYNAAQGRMLPDLEALGSWLHKYGYLHKTLKEYTTAELPALITQVERMMKSVNQPKIKI